MRVRKFAILAAAVLAGGSSEAEDPGVFQVDVVRGGAVSRVVGTENGEITEVTMREDPRPLHQPRPSTRREPSSDSASQTTFYLIVNRTDEGYPLYDHAFVPLRWFPRHRPRPSARYRYRLPWPHDGSARSSGGRKFPF